MVWGGNIAPMREGRTTLEIFLPLHPKYLRVLFNRPWCNSAKEVAP